MESFKLLSIFYLFSLLFHSSSNNNKELIDLAPLYKEIEGCYNYFMDTTNFIEDSKVYGLEQDR